MDTSASTPSTPSIATGTTIGTVRLTVADLDRSRSFYQRALGMTAVEEPGGIVALGTRAIRNSEAAAPPLLELRGDRSAPPVDHRRTGLFHFAVLVPTRRDLAISVMRLATARASLTGASDHLVSEALYLDDPDGNGIEIYRDRERSEWPHEGGRLRMATLPLDIDGLLSTELAGASPTAATLGDSALPSGTTIGHVHLQVADLHEAEAFYHGVLGFDVMVRDYPGALFVSAGGYHHHLGLNTWRSAGAPAPPPEAAGLRSFQVRLGDETALAEVLARVEAADVHRVQLDGGTLVRDPSGNGVLLTV
jgi:catechol 2,3-dioxygenase